MHPTPTPNPEPADAAPAAGIVETGPWTGIGNEFTGVQVRKVWTRNGERLEVRVPRSGRYILLDPMQLEVVAEQNPEFFTDLIKVRLGSEDDEGQSP